MNDNQLERYRPEQWLEKIVPVVGIDLQYTIEGIREKRRDLAIAIGDLITAFQDEVKVAVHEIDVEHFYNDESYTPVATQINIKLKGL